MLSKQQKRELVKELADTIRNSENIVVSDFTGLAMGEMTRLRRDLRKHGVLYRAVKKTLLDLAWRMSGKPRPDFLDHKSAAAVACGGGDPIAMVKVVHAFVKATKKLAILGGFLMGGPADREKIIALAQLPPRDVLLAQVARQLASPLSGLVRTLEAVSKKVIQA